MKKCMLVVLLLALNLSFTIDKEITWVAIGDSITYLNDHPNETGNRISKGYMTMLTEKLPNVHYLNQGHNGWTAIKIATDIEKLGLQKADVYSIFLGTNDWWGGKPLGTLDNYKNNTGLNTVNGAFRVITDKLKSLNPQAKIIFITPMQRVDFVYINNFKNNAYGSYKDKNGQFLESFANAIVEIGRMEHFPVVDLYHNKKLSHPNLVQFKRLKNPNTGEYQNYTFPDFTNIPFDPVKDEYPYPMESIQMTYDGLHPSDKGYEVITKALLKEFKSL
ncbi:SGNH/GDSL hydrolase family protein [Aquirufa sp. ROCK-SH2]